MIPFPTLHNSTHFYLEEKKVYPTSRLKKKNPLGPPTTSELILIRNLNHSIRCPDKLNDKTSAFIHPSIPRKEQLNHSKKKKKFSCKKKGYSSITQLRAKHRSNCTSQIKTERYLFPEEWTEHENEEANT